MKLVQYLILCLLLSACSGSFLELYPETDLNEGNFYQSEEEYVLLANGCYIPLRNMERNIHWIIAEMVSDNTSYQNPSDGGNHLRSAIDEFRVEANNTIYSNFWVISYDGISRCNKLLAELENSTVRWSSDELRNRTEGEALFLRALYYFNLVRQFGGVPLVLTPITSREAVGIKRSSEEAVLDQIQADLLAAVTAFSNASGVHEDGRAGEGAARSLLGKLYLTRGNFPAAEKQLETVIGSGDYLLLPNYADLFNPSSKDFKETIFSVQYSETSAELANRFIFMFAPWTSRGEVTQRPSVNIRNSGSGWNQPTQDLIDAFEPGDARYAVSIGYWTGPDWDGQTRTIPYCAKYKPPVSAPDDRAGDNFPILRYSDVLLMYAEALNAQGRTSDAIPYVYQVRSRANLTDPVTGYNQASLAELIAAERQREFCFENQRWYDLKRTGKALEVMAPHGVLEKSLRPYLPATSFQLEEYMLRAPIPVEQILVNQLEQNDGY